jgi:hypothetical protein
MLYRLSGEPRQMGSPRVALTTRAHTLLRNMDLCVGYWLSLSSDSMNNGSSDAPMRLH